MIERCNRASVRWGIAGAFFQILGGLIQVIHYLWGPPNTGTVLGYNLIAIGMLLLIMGCCQFAKAKGRSTAWCLLGFLGIPGWIALFIILNSMKDLTCENRSDYVSSETT